MLGEKARLGERLYDQMKVLVLDGDAVGEASAKDAADWIRSVTARRGTANAMFATGNSQLAFLDHLVGEDDLDWSRVAVLHMDEYLGMHEGHPASFQRYIRERLVERLPMPPAEALYIRGDVPDAQEECRRYAALLASHPLDICVLGIGENGHLAFNDPHVADLDDPLDVKVVQLDEVCRHQQVGEGHFPGLADVPRSAITVTVPALLRARRVIAVAPEARKAAAVREALTGPVTAACPASVLRTRANVVLYLDRDSAAGLA